MLNKKKEAGQKVWPFDTLPVTSVWHGVSLVQVLACSSIVD